ncbi:MAG: YkvA family protein, partial [Bosea sp. (in: a-proteobacteria)]
TPARIKMILISAVAYFVLPIDAIPDIIPLFGFSDDAAVIAAALAAVASELKPVHREKARAVLDDI